MICPKCGQEALGNYCSNCGFLLVPDNEDDIDEYFPPDNERQRTKVYRTNPPARQSGREGSRRNPGHSPLPENRDCPVNSAYADNRGDLRPGTDPYNNANIDNRAIRKKPVSRKAKARPSKSKDSNSRRGADKKVDKKENQKKENRIKKLENEMERLRAQKEDSRSHPMTGKRGIKRNRRKWNEQEPESRDSNYYGRGEGRIQEADNENSVLDEFGESITKGAVGIVVIASRLMQLLSALLMAAMVCLMADAFWQNGQNLGDIRYLVEERNYGLAFYGAAALFTLVTGLLWCLWILSKKGAGGGIRLKRYDTGRGLLPFLLCLAAVFAAGILLPQVPVKPEALKGIAGGAKAALKAVNNHRELLFFGSGLGAVLSLLRKILSV